jgi:hypothetical protein
MKIGIGLPTQLRNMELILHPTIVDTDEVGKLADAVLR